MVLKVQINLRKNKNVNTQKITKKKRCFYITVDICHERIYVGRESLSFPRDTRSLFESNRLFPDLQRHHYTLDTNWDLKIKNSNNSKKSLTTE